MGQNQGKPENATVNTFDVEKKKWTSQVTISATEGVGKRGVRKEYVLRTKKPQKNLLRFLKCAGGEELRQKKKRIFFQVGEQGRERDSGKDSLQKGEEGMVQARDQHRFHRRGCHALQSGG